MAGWREPQATALTTVLHRHQLDNFSLRSKWKFSPRWRRVNMGSGFKSWLASVTGTDRASLQRKSTPSQPTV